MIRLTLDCLSLLNPQWSNAALHPGREVSLSVDAPDFSAEQSVRFDIYRALEWIDSVQTVAGKTSAKWIPPNLAGASTLVFQARLVEKPSPANGQSGIAFSIASPNATLNGFSLTVTTIDVAFVPKQENLEVVYNVVDPDAAAKKGRIEIWGERYPGAVAAPLYTHDFSPAVGATTWSDWSGKANAGHLNGKYITPEFSPYTVRLILGPNSASVKDPGSVGQGLVAIVETQFEIIVHSVHIKLQEKLKLQAKLDEFKMDEVLGVEPRAADGTFAFSERLPLAAETGRIRIPMARHHARGEALDQGGQDIAGGYLAGGGNKYDADRDVYSRPELPIEFEPRFRSRVAATNGDILKRGLFEKEAVGPLEIEPVAEDFYLRARYADGGAPSVDQLYFKNSAFKLKRGTHNVPYHDLVTNKPEYSLWQARLEVTALGTQDFNITTCNVTDTCGYTIGANELKVYLNRALLDLSARVDDNELVDGTKGYREIAAGLGAGLDVQIRLAPNLTKDGDIIWVVRTLPLADGEAIWKKFPPGPNSSAHYGGARGLDPTADLSNYFRANFSPDPVSPLEPIIGKTKSAYRYTTYVKMRPEGDMPVADQERVVISALTSGSRRGHSGVLFSPSWLSGDSYVLHAHMDQEPYQRRFGFIQPTTRPIDSRTGTMNVWRHLQFANSLRMPLTASGGLPAGVGFGADASAPYHGDGVNMSFTVMNRQFADAYYEWTISDKGTIRKDVPLKKYRKAHGLYSTGHVGKVELSKDSQIKDQFIQYDYYRELLPPGIPANRVNVAANAIALVARGTASPTAGAAVIAAIGNHVPVADAALSPGVAAIPVWGGSPGDYFFQAFGRWKDTIAYFIVDLLTPVDPAPRKMNIVRWAQLHESPIWNDAAGNAVGTTGMSWEGESMGNGNSLIRAGTASATLFAHEMGHSTHLVHMVAGNFGWKHHHINSPDCYMSYTHTEGTIWCPAGSAGAQNAATPMPLVKPWPLTHGGTDVEVGWPHWNQNPNSGNLEWCIHFGNKIVLGDMCAKCSLKLRGWKDEFLPIAWLHPDLY